MKPETRQKIRRLFEEKLRPGKDSSGSVLSSCLAASRQGQDQENQDQRQDPMGSAIEHESSLSYVVVVQLYHICQTTQKLDVFAF